MNPTPPLSSQPTEAWVKIIQQFKDDTGFDLNSSPEFDNVNDAGSLLSVLDDRHALFGTSGDRKDESIKQLKEMLNMMDAFLILMSGLDVVCPQNINGRPPINKTFNRSSNLIRYYIGPWGFYCL